MSETQLLVAAQLLTTTPALWKTCLPTVETWFKFTFPPPNRFVEHSARCFTVRNHALLDGLSPTFPQKLSDQLRLELFDGTGENGIAPQHITDLAAGVQDRAVIPAAEIAADLLE